jgi:Tfp pilus assembly protein PilV
MRRAISEKGFTFFDVLQASTLSAIAMVGISSMLLTTMRSTIRGRDLTTAATVAEAKIEELGGMSFADLADGSDTVTEAEVPFARKWALTAGPTAGTREVSVIVEWPGQGARGIELRSILFE